MGKGKAPDTLQYEIIRKNERRRAYQAVVQRNKRINTIKKRKRSEDWLHDQQIKNGTK